MVRPSGAIVERGKCRTCGRFALSVMMTTVVPTSCKARAGAAVPGGGGGFRHG